MSDETKYETPESWYENRRGTAEQWAESLSDYELDRYANSPDHTIRFLAKGMKALRRELAEWAFKAGVGLGRAKRCRSVLREVLATDRPYSKELHDRIHEALRNDSDAT